jgi:rhamnosyl/mannosyltransferase
MLQSARATEPRILHACPAYRPDAYGGIATAVAHLCTAWPGSLPSVMTCGADGASTVDGVRVRRAACFGSLYPRPAAPGWPMRFWQEARRADLVVVHAPFPAAEVAAVLHLPRGVGLVVHFHADTVSDNRLGRVRAPLTRALLSRADAIVVAASILASTPLLAPYRDKVAIVPFGVDTATWSAAPSGDEVWRAALLRTSFPRLVVAVGPLQTYKGFDVLIEAMRLVDAHLLIVGDGPCRAALQRRIDEAGLARRVTLCRAVSPPELRLLLRNADVFAFPSVLPRETFGIAQLEAMACGRPVVNTALPTAVPWVARHGHEALTVPPGQPRALAEAIGLLLEYPELARRLGDAGRERVRMQFSLAMFRERIQHLYGSVLARLEQPAVHPTLRHVEHPSSHPTLHHTAVEG